MKEITHEEWMKNPTPRLMWVWDDDETCRGKLKVIYFSRLDVIYPIIALADNDIDIGRYKHCAEITKQRRMTNKELASWLREKPTREFKYNNSIYTYDEYCEDEEVPEDICIRENDSEWREPLVEVEE